MLGVLLVVVVLEGLARIMGYRPLHWQHYQIASQPQHSITGDERFGFALVPGRFTVTINQGLTYHAQHLPTKRRYCDLDTTAQNVLGFFGCSLTYGMGVDDSQTFVAQQARYFPHWHVQNHAVPGFGTTQSLLQIKQLQQQQALPQIVVLCFSNWHFERNALTPTFRRNLTLGYGNADKQAQQHMQKAAFPVLSNHQIRYHPWKALYHNWPGRNQWALVNAFNTFYDEYGDRQSNSLALSLELIDQIAAICHKAQSSFIVLLLDESEKVEMVKQDLAAKGIAYAQTDWDLNKPEDTNYPYDQHMSPAAHKRVGASLQQVLIQKLHFGQ